MYPHSVDRDARTQSGDPFSLQRGRLIAKLSGGLLLEVRRHR